MERAARRITPSLAVAFALWVLVAAAVALHPPRNIISWDTFGYHLYLPAALLHGDPGIRDRGWVEAADAAYDNTGTLYQLTQLPDGRWVNRYPMGLALLWSPFFATGHAAAAALGAPRDGFSWPYQAALIAAGLTYLLVGLLTLRRVLRWFFTEAVTAATLALLVTGTNLFHQAAAGLGMPHIFLFALGAGVLWRTIRWRAQGRARDAAAVGFLLGLMVVSRPSEAVWAVVPLMAGCGEAGRLRAHGAWLWQRRSHLLLLAAVAALVTLPQLAYWKWMTGRWLYMSYNNPGEGFEFLRPFTREALFSFRKGWYVYTPLMLVATLGLAVVWRTLPAWRWALTGFFALNLYVVSSWSCWWYADSFGQRALVQGYAVMAIPLGAVLTVLKERPWRARAALPLLLALTALNLFQTWQIERGILHTSRMTWPAYKAAWMRTAPLQGMDALLLVDRVQEDFTRRPDLTGYRASAVLRAANGALQAVYGEAVTTDHAWVEVRFRPGPVVADSVEVMVAMEHGGYPYHARTTRWAVGDSIRMWYLTPEVRRASDRLMILCREPSGEAVLAGSLEVHVHEH